MKLLLDQNLSRHLVTLLANRWPDVSHVCMYGLEQATDRELWDFAAVKGYCLVSKDNDFLNLALLHGAPPKVIIVRTGNATTSDLQHCLLSYSDEMIAFYHNPTESVLIIP